MASDEEIGFVELRKLVRRDWKLIVGLGVLCGAATLAAVWLVLPETYLATARLAVHPAAHGNLTRSIELYQSLLESDSVLSRASRRLEEAGSIELDNGLQLDREVSVGSVSAIRDGSPTGTSFLTVTGRSDDPEAAAAIANAVAEEFILASRTMMRSPAVQSETVLNEQLLPTRQSLEVVEEERTVLRDDFQQREEAISTDWDRRIGAAKRKAAVSTASYQTETRNALTAEVRRFLSVLPEPADLGELRADLQDLVSVRAQLAQTPRVLTLEKAVADETLLAELIVEARNADLLDTTLVTEEANQLYDSLAMRALEIEGALKTTVSAEAPSIELTGLLNALEAIQQERAAGLTSLLEGATMEIRTLRRRRSRALEALTRQKSTELAVLERRHKQLSELEMQLVAGLNEALVTRLLEDAAVVEIAAPAVANSFSEPRDVPIKTAAGAFLGLMLGLMLALFRSDAKA